MRFLVLILAAVVGIAGVAEASDFTFSATLRGDAAPTNTGSKATGSVAIVVHGDTQTLDVSATVSGIAPADFAKHLAHAPVGPMHLHIYAPNGDVSLLLPFPMGPEYQAAGGGFTYKRTGYAYAEGAKILSSTISFDDFVKALGAARSCSTFTRTRLVMARLAGRLRPRSRRQGRRRARTGRRQPLPQPKAVADAQVELCCSVACPGNSEFCQSPLPRKEHPPLVESAA